MLCKVPHVETPYKGMQSPASTSVAGRRNWTMSIPRGVTIGSLCRAFCKEPKVTVITICSAACRPPHSRVEIHQLWSAQGLPTDALARISAGTERDESLPPICAQRLWLYARQPCVHSELAIPPSWCRRLVTLGLCTESPRPPALSEPRGMSLRAHHHKKVTH